MSPRERDMEAGRKGIIAMKVSLHHVAIAVRDIRAQREGYMERGFTCTDIVYDPIQNVELSMCVKAGGTAVELVGVHNEKSPVFGLLNKVGRDDLAYHLCYHVEHVQKTLAALREKGVSFSSVTKEDPAILFQGEPVCFIYVNGVGLIELTEDARYGAYSIADRIDLVTNKPEHAAKFFAVLGYTDAISGAGSVAFSMPQSTVIQITAAGMGTEETDGYYKKLGPHLYNIHLAQNYIR